jgi:enamine deaminase RidA (YjgF/YER057c/UK114 family)
MSCCILRLGQKMDNDSIEITLEDIENSINQRQMNLEKYVKQIGNNIKRYISQYWETDITDEELEMFTGDFIDELIFLQDEFPFVQDIILEFDKSIL